MGDLGFFGITIPEDLGGLGLGCFEYCVVAEQLARGWMSVASIMARGNSFYTSIPALNDDEKRKKIKLMAQGKYLGAFSMSEPSAGSDVASIACRAVDMGDHWEVTGNKYWCTFADKADFIQVICRTDTDPDTPKWAGLTSIVFEKPKVNFLSDVREVQFQKSGIMDGKLSSLLLTRQKLQRLKKPRRGAHLSP